MPTLTPADSLENVDEGWWNSVLQEAESRLSLQRAEAPAELFHDNPAADWAEASQLYADDQATDVEVVGYNRGGLLVMFRSLRGFIPVSHLIDFPINGASEELRRVALLRRVGQKLRVKVIEIDPEKSRVVFSERAARSTDGARHNLLSQLEVGAVVHGLVTNVCDFGAFVDLGGVEGLIHVSEVSWNRVSHTRDVLSVDQTIQVAVISIDRVNNRVALSYKRTRPDPWATVAERYHVGQVVEGRVTSVVNFGAFVALEDGLEGLIHVSELAEGQFLHPRNVIREGETVRAQVLVIDGAHRRLSLSLRRLEPQI